MKHTLKISSKVPIRKTQYNGQKTLQWPKDTIQWPKDTVQWPKDTVQWPKDTIQWPKEKGQKDKQWLKNATQKTFRNTNPTKNRDALSIHIVSKWTLPNIDLTIVVH